MKVRCEIDVDPVTLELYELEVTPPRDDFELEVKRAEQAAECVAISYPSFFDDLEYLA